MTSRWTKALLTGFAILLTYMTLWFSWIVGQQAVLTALVVGAGVWLVAKIQGAPAAAAVPADDAAPQPEPDGHSDWLVTVLGAAGLLSAWFCYSAALNQAWGLAALWILVGALVWRGGLPLRLPQLPLRGWTVLLGLALLAAAVFRLYQAGEIPIGFDSYDEGMLKSIAHDLLMGQRPTMIIAPGVTGDGALPHYLMALGMRFFGTGMFGFRISAIVCGILVTFIVFHLGRDKGGAWLGVAAALLWAVCLWPVSISRAHYLLVETHMVVLACLALAVKGVQKERPLHFALAGLALAFSMQVYHAAQIMVLLLPLLLALVAILQPERRGAIVRGLVPLLAGLLVGLGPLLLWAWTDPRDAYTGFFGVLYAGHIGGASASLGPLAALDSLLARAIPFFPAAVQMFTVRGPFHAFYFPALEGAFTGFPLFNPAIFVLFLAGLSVCLARFRRPYFAFLVFWWLVALLPGLISNPASQPDDRRTMMVMPPMLILAAIGWVTSMDFLVRGVPARARRGAFAALGLVFLAYLVPVSWSDYFYRNQRDTDLLTYNKANTTAQARAIFDEGRNAPVSLISTQGLNVDSWSDPNYEPTNVVYPALATFPTLYAQHTPDYYTGGGLVSALRWAASMPKTPSGKLPDVLVALTPFHFYLEPLLHRLGGTTVREVKVLQTNQGPLAQGIGMAPAVHGLSLKVVRLACPVQGLDELARDDAYHFTAEELVPPDGQDRSLVEQEPVLGPEIKSLTLDYQAHPQRWKAHPAQAFSLVDPWFWMTAGTMPGGINPPLRMRVSFQLEIKQDGLYAFGASATPYTTLKVDGKTVFTFLPFIEPIHSSELWASEKEGVLGEAVPLKAGIHRLDAEQVWLSKAGNYSHVFRLIWKAPGGEKETLPLEVLKPIPVRAKGAR
jgi:hypothetical protein